jgi:zinc-ribbon domain
MSQLATCPHCGSEVPTSADVCPRCGQPVTTGPGPVVTRRWGGKYEAAGFACILAGLGLFFWMPRLGALLFIGGVALFMVGRFWSRRGASHVHQR